MIRQLVIVQPGSVSSAADHAKAQHKKGTARIRNSTKKAQRPEHGVGWLRLGRWAPRVRHNCSTFEVHGQHHGLPRRCGVCRNKLCGTQSLRGLAAEDQE